MNDGLSSELSQKLDQIKTFLKDKKVVVALSGGIDSSLMVYLSKTYAKQTLAVIGESYIFPEYELKDAIEFASKYDIPYEILELNPLEMPEFQKNPKERCYICKTLIFTEILKVKDSAMFDFVIDGTNYDDIGDYRPGLKALKELGIKSPFKEFGLTKEDIRILSKYFELGTEDKPSMACYASRIPYNEEISKKKIDMVARAEAFLWSGFSFSQLRVRLHNGNLARIEVLKEEMNTLFQKNNRTVIIEKFKEIGFTYITLDLQGFRSGSLNESFF